MREFRLPAEVLLLLVACSLGAVSANICSAPPTIIRGCEPFLSVLTRTTVQYSAIYFADNPRSNATVLNPGKIVPPTPGLLLKSYYGVGATSANFEKALLQMYYADPGPNGPVNGDDRNIIQLRENIYTYAKASSYHLAREKFGVLLYIAAAEHTRGSTDWKANRCLRKRFVEPVERVIFLELEKVRNEIGEFRFGQFLELGSGTTLAFVIDDTGSMSNEIHAAKARAKMILRERQGSLDQPQDFVLVPFNDPTVGPLTVTNDPTVFTTAIDRLYAHGGGDAPELAMRGILLAIENCRFGSTIFVITDIDAKDVELQDLVVAQAKKKGIKVIFLLTNRIRTTMCQRTLTAKAGLAHRRCATSSFKRGYALYKYIAESTGGNVLVITKNQIFRATQVIDNTVKQGVVDVSHEVVSGRMTKRFSLDVDETLTELFFQFLGSCSDITISHDDLTLALQDTFTIGNLFEGRVPVNKKYGKWWINVTSGNSCTIKTVARSTKGFILTLLKVNKVKSVTTTCEIFKEQALFSDNVVMLLNSFGGFKLSQVRAVKLVGKATGRVLHTYRISKTKTNTIRIPLTARPRVVFYVLVVGVDVNGVAFSRLMSTVEFVNIDIQFDNIQNVVFRPGDTAKIHLTIKNDGKSLSSVQFGVSDSRNYVQGGVRPSTKRIQGNGGTTKASFIITAAKNAVPGLVTVITVTAKSSRSSSLVYRTARLVVNQRSRPRVIAFSVRSKIMSRFAETTMTSVAYNHANLSREAEFYVLLPKDAFITGFTMTVDNQTFHGQIREKERAQQIYNLAKERDITAGHVASRDESTSVFRTSVNLGPFKRGTFVLKYQELLVRKLGKYTYNVAVRMLQPVTFFSIVVSICETDMLKSVKVLGFKTDQTTISGPTNLPGARVVKSRTTAVIRYTPSPLRQSEISPFGLNGKFVVEYELGLVPKKGEMLLTGSHFVHFLQPGGLPMPKRVIFVLDVSGSMYGLKMAQLRSAMSSILKSFLVTDVFSILAFNGSVTSFPPNGSASSMVPATSENIQKANDFLAKIQPGGGTDLLKALYAAISLMREFVESGQPNSLLGGPTGRLAIADTIVVLTDGRSTEGIVNSKSIEQSVYIYNNKSFSINTIGFGTLVDMNSLTKLAAQNQGRSVQVFPDIDAHVQIGNFFQSISSPVLSEVIVDYPKRTVRNTGKTKFPAYFANGELVLTGELVLNGNQSIYRRPVFRTGPMQQQVQFTVTGKTRKGEQKVTDDITPRSLEVCSAQDLIANFTQRMHIFIQLKGLLRQINAATDKTVEMRLRKIAVERSMQFSFVTPGITSMIVIKPDDVRELESALRTTAPPTAVPSTRSAPAATTTSDRRIYGFRPATLVIRPEAFAAPPTRPISPVMEMVGDPHVFVDLNEDITVCFNWNAKENEVYSIVSDVESGIYVNAKMIEVPDHNDRPCFLGEIAIILKKLDTTIFVDPYKLVTYSTGQNVVELGRNQTATKTVGNLVFEVERINHVKSIFTITVENKVQFRIIGRVHWKATGSRNHVDFSITKKDGLSTRSKGLLGQFPHRKGNLDASLTITPKSRMATIRYKGHQTHVIQHHMLDSYSRKRIACWYVLDFTALTGETHDHYKLDQLLATPR